MAEPEKCEITCLKCQTAFSVNNGDDEINFRCPVCALRSLLTRCQRVFSEMGYVDYYHALYGTDDSVQQIEADIQAIMKEKRAKSKELSKVQAEPTTVKKLVREIRDLVCYLTAPKSRR